MIEICRSIPASRRVVWSLMSELDRWDELLPTVSRVTRVGEPGPVVLGSRFRVEQPCLPTATYEVIDWQAGSAFTWAAAGPGVTAVASLSLVDTAGGSRLTLRIDWCGPAAGLMRLLLSRKARTYMEREAATFSQLATEADGA